MVLEQSLCVETLTSLDTQLDDPVIIAAAYSYRHLTHRLAGMSTQQSLPGSLQQSLPGSLNAAPWTLLAHGPRFGLELSWQGR